MILHGMKPRQLLASVTCVLLGSCTEPSSSPAILKLEVAQQRWQATVHPDYDLTVQRSCFCVMEVVRPVRITVRNGNPVGMVYADSGTAVDTVLFADYRTVDRMFAFLRAVIASKPDSIQVAFDPVWGYPTRVAVDPNFTTVDEEFAFQVSGFTTPPVLLEASRPR
jgi:hypothetical protein